MKKVYLFTLIALVFIMASCSKNGVNPNAAKNPITTPSIITTLTTITGNVLLVGNVLPTLSVGQVGYFYLDVANGYIYGPKTASSWGLGYSLKGPVGNTGATGATGAAGTQIYSGSGAPASTLGTYGDYYMDLTNILLYGPKTVGQGWGVPINLVGPQGPTGPQGPQGPPGGSSSVKTDVFTVNGSDWLWNSQYIYETSPGSYTEYFTRYYVRKNNTISQYLLNNGLVLVYFTPSPVYNPTQWEPLPYQFDSSFGYTDNYVYVTAVGQVTLHYFFIQTDPTATLPTLSTYNDESRQFKIVSIAGVTGTFMAAHHVNLNNYEEVSKITGLWQQDIQNAK
jgi:hypothetical protein